MLLPELRQTVCDLHAELPKSNLVARTSGNISGRDPAGGLLFSELTPDSMIIVDENGAVIEGELKPSSDTASHCYICRHMPHAHGSVHTHSRYATAFAVLGREIPYVTTARSRAAASR